MGQWGCIGKEAWDQRWLNTQDLLFVIPCHRKLREEELQATSLPSIPNPFPELCSPPSQKPILGGSSSARGLLSRDSSCLHVSCLGKGGEGCSRPLWCRWGILVPEDKSESRIIPSHLQFLGYRW